MKTCQWFISALEWQCNSYGWVGISIIMSILLPFYGKTKHKAEGFTSLTTVCNYWVKITALKFDFKINLWFSLFVVVFQWHKKNLILKSFKHFIACCARGNFEILQSFVTFWHHRKVMCFEKWHKRGHFS